MLRDSVFSVLLVSAGEKFNDSLISLLPESEYSPRRIEKDITSARRAILDRNYDIVIVNSPLPDEFGGNFAIDIASDTNSGVLLFVKNDIYDEVSVKVEDYGVMVVGKPATKASIRQSLALLTAMRTRLLKMERKTETFEEKMNEIRLVNHAKWLLIENESLREDDAHKFIEQNAMKSRKTRREIAEEIINKYEKK